MTIDLVNPCQDTPTTINDHVIPDQTVILDGPEITYVVGDFTDTVSTTLWPYDGSTFCGARSFVFNPPELASQSGNDWSLQALTADGYTDDTVSV